LLLTGAPSKKIQKYLCKTNVYASDVAIKNLKMKLQQFTGSIKIPRVTLTLFALECIEIIVDFNAEKIIIHKRPWCIYTLLQLQ